MTMGYNIIEITSEEKDELKEKAKKLLKCGKELYECIEELADTNSERRPRKTASFLTPP